jgi:flagellar biosynthesis/type III secretory pathway protein FliH
MSRDQTRDVRPFLAHTASPTRPLTAALRSIDRPPPTSPWLPRVVTELTAAAAVPIGPSEAELEAIYSDARERGRADGLAETADLREQLTGLVEELAAVRAAVAAPAAELISELACCVVEAWTESAERGALFAPVVRSWALRAPDQPATARVHPEDIAALTAVIGDAALTVVGDPALAPGTIQIRNPTLELCHDWRARLGELRTAIAGALGGAEP